MTLTFPERYLLGLVPFATIAGAMAVIMHDHPSAAVIAIVSNIILASPAVVGLVRQLGLRNSWWPLVTLSCFAYAIESFGVRFGIPYGEFFYSQQLGPLWLSGVPVILPLSWVPLVLGSVVLARQLSKHRLAASLMAACLLVGVDLLLDPVAAKLQYWTWINYGPIYGVPLTNFAGWFLSGFIGAQLVPPFTPSNATTAFLLQIAYLIALLMWSAASVVCGFYATAALGYLLSALTIWLMRKPAQLH